MSIPDSSGDGTSGLDSSTHFQDKASAAPPWVSSCCTFESKLISIHRPPPDFQPMPCFFMNVNGQGQFNGSKGAGAPLNQNRIGRIKLTIAVSRRLQEPAREWFP